MSAHCRFHGPARPSRTVQQAMAGFTLIELMVALLLGLVVIAGVGSVFLSNQQVYRTNKALSDVQDSARVAFEMMARDIRTAGLTGCGNSARVANVLNSTAWWANWNNALVGYAASQSDPVAGNKRTAKTESIILVGAEASGVSVKLNTEPGGSFTLNEASTNLQAGDVVIVCDPDHAAIVQLSSATGATLTHATGGTPGNCTNDLSYPTVCSSGSSYVFAPNALVARVNAANWYVGANGDGGSSLYRLALSASGGRAVTMANEMVRDVTMLTLSYHSPGDAAFLPADQVTDWSKVDAVRASLTIVSSDKHAGTGAQPVSRTLTSTTALRNRVL